MRVTHQSLSRNYIKRMNTNLGKLSQSNDKLTSGRKINKGFENVADAGKALRLRNLVNDNVKFQSTVRDVKGRAESAEDSVRTVNSLMNRAEELLVQGLNGTMSADDRSKLSAELTKLQDETLQLMNASYGGSYLFSSAGSGQANTAPFEVKDGILNYNGTPVDAMVKVNGKITYNGDEIPYNVPNYVDIGFGYKDKNGSVDPNTAFKDTYSGVESFGYGRNADGVPVNAWSLFGNMVNNLNNNNLDGLNKDLEALPGSMEFMLTSITEIGARGTLLNDTADRLENEYQSLVDNQNKVEFVDVAEEIMYNKTYEMGWMVTLQLGNRILPQSLFDFMR